MFIEVERALIPKHHGTGADRIVSTPDIAAVVDGATVSEPCECCDGSAAARAADVVADVIGALPTDARMQDFLDAAHRALVDATSHLPCRGRAWSASAVVASAMRGEVWLVGDCAAIVGGQRARIVKKVDEVAAAFRSAVDNAALRAGRTTADLQRDDEGRAAIMPLLRRQRAFRNSTADRRWSFPSLATEATPPELCRVIELPTRADAPDVVLASDGYPELWPTLAASEAALADVLREDPLLVGDLPSTKGLTPGAASFDDRAFLRIRLVPPSDRSG